MSDQGDAQRWHPVSNESGIEPDDPTGPMPAVTGEEPGFPPVGDESVAWSAETTGGFSAPPERAPFEPADAAPGEEQSFSALRRSLAERLARYTEPEGGWPDPSPTDPTPPFGTTASDTGENEGWPPSFGGSADDGTAEFAQDKPPSRDLAEESGQESSYGSLGESAHRSPYGFAEKTVQEPSHGSTEETVHETSYGFAGETVHKSSYGSAEETVHETSYGFAEETVHKSSYGSAEKTVQEPPHGSVGEAGHGPSYGFAGKGSSFADGAKHSPYRSAEEDAENEFFGSDEDARAWDKVITPSGPPPRPGKPSSGNMRLPEWMKDGGTEPPGGGHDEQRRSRLPLYSGIGVLVLGLLTVGGVVLLKNGDDGLGPVDRATSPTAPAGGPAGTPREKALARFRGPHTRPAGLITDRRAGLSYPRLRSPWVMASKKSSLGEIGFNMSQFAVTERAGGRPRRWGRLMSAELAGAEAPAYHGPGTERAAALQAADLLEARMYAFRHRKRLLASQPLNVDGHRGWLVGYYLTYHRPLVQATAEVFTVAVVDTGRAAPGVLCMTVPNTDRRLWPDVNYVMRALRVS